MDPQTTWEAELAGYRIVFGVNALEQLGEQVRRAGGSRALIVTDSGVRRAGHIDSAAAALDRAGVACAVFDGVENNPTTRHVVAGVEAARDHRADCLIGIGGGSAMDCAKGVNFLLTGGGRMEDYWGTGKATKPMLPSLGVPTTAGTGSEAQSYALICQEGTRVKMACGDKRAMFRAVVLDPALASSAPSDVAGIAGIDAVAHAVESHVSTRRTPISQLLSREAWRLLGANLPAVLGPEPDLVAWGGVLLGAHLAGAAIEQSMLGAAHACANPLTARFPIPHGVAVGLMLPHVIRFNAAHVGELYDELSRLTDPNGAPRLLEERVQELRALAGLPESLRDCSVSQDCFPELAADAERQWTASFNPRPVKKNDLVALYEAAHA